MGCLKSVEGCLASGSAPSGDAFDYLREGQSCQLAIAFLRLPHQAMHVGGDGVGVYQLFQTIEAAALNFHLRERCGCGFMLRYFQREARVAAQ